MVREDVCLQGPGVAAGVRIGDVLAGKYRVDRVLGMGGMGVVVEAQHLQLADRVAIKFLLPEMLENPEVVGRFLREARAAVRVKSEHVARVFDVGTLDTGAPYMVMEFLDGGDLGAWLEQHGPPPIDQAVTFVLQACEAIAEAHALRIVHRDLKPANLFVIRRADGQLSIKVLDFGISKATTVGSSSVDAAMTKTTAVLGSPLYMSPEQMRSARDVDARTDIWALGVVLHELVTGEAPFSGETFPDLCVNIATQPAPSVRTSRPDASPGLEEVIAKCLEKDPSRRYQNVAELALALAPLGSRRSRESVQRICGTIQAAGLSASAIAPPSSPAPSSERGQGTLASWGSTGRASTRRSSWSIAMVVALLGMTGTGIWWRFIKSSRSIELTAPGASGLPASIGASVASSSFGSPLPPGPVSVPAERLETTPVASSVMPRDTEAVAPSAPPPTPGPSGQAKAGTTPVRAPAQGARTETRAQLPQTPRHAASGAATANGEPAAASAPSAKSPKLEGAFDDRK